MIDASVWDSDALYPRGSGERGRAGANLFVLGRHALSVEATRVPLGARSLALALDAHFEVTAKRQIHTSF